MAVVKDVGQAKKASFIFLLLVCWGTLEYAVIKIDEEIVMT